MQNHADKENVLVTMVRNNNAYLTVFVLFVTRYQSHIDCAKNKIYKHIWISIWSL